MEKPQRQNSFIIVGAGCFGASTALHLKQLLPLSDVVLIDRTPFPNPSAAAHDLNKVVRTDYDDILYMKLALEAMQMWKTDPLYRDYYHESGIVWAGPEKMIDGIMQNYQALGIPTSAERLDPQEARKRWGGLLREINWTGLKQALFNPNAGWADAESALRATTQKAVDLGVTYVPEGVHKLLFHEDGTCVGVQTSSGNIKQADHILLCTGANTAQILADSAPKNPELQVGDRLVAAAAIMCLYKVPDDQISKYKSAPVIINALDHTQGESIPPGDAGLCKCTHEESFTNKITHSSSGQQISVPPSRESQREWSEDVPAGLKKETDVVAEHLYGRWITGLKPVQYRMCWDAVTPTQNFIISPHSKAKNLYIATGGSFHSWKFMPNIGSYVVKMLLGSLDEERRQRWGWDRDNDGDGACDMYLPHRDLKDIDGYGEEKLDIVEESLDGHWLKVTKKDS